jgi:hypothetical protein
VKANEDNPEFARRFGWLLVAAKLTRRKLAMLREPDKRRAAALNSRMGRWERDGKSPDRATLLWVLAVIAPPEALDVTASWLLDRGPVPLWLRSRVPEAVGGSVVPDVSPAIAPAQPTVRGNRAEELLEDGARRALDALRNGQNAAPILEGVLKLVRDARQLGLASILSFAMIGASAAVPQHGPEDSSRSGGIGRRARFRGVRILPRAPRSPKLKQSSSARRRRGEIITLDDLARTPALPKIALRPQAA